MTVRTPSDIPETLGHIDPIRELRRKPRVTRRGAVNRVSGHILVTIGEWSKLLRRSRDRKAVAFSRVQASTVRDGRTSMWCEGQPFCWPARSSARASPFLL